MRLTETGYVYTSEDKYGRAHLEKELDKQIIEGVVAYVAEDGHK